MPRQPEFKLNFPIIRTQVQKADFHKITYLYLFYRESLVNDRPTLAINTSSIQGNPAEKDTCPRCGGMVFHAERMLSKNNVISCIYCI